MAFTRRNPFSLHRGSLPPRLGVLRLIFMCAAAAGALQLLLPVFVRLALGGGRVFYGDDEHSLWGAALPWPILSIPAWLTVATALIGCVAGSAYLILGAADTADDIPYVTVLAVLFFGVFPWFIAALDTDPGGLISTPGAEGYPIGWHWLATPLVLLVIAGAIIGGVKAHRAQDDALARLRATRAAYREQQGEQ